MRSWVSPAWRNSDVLAAILSITVLGGLFGLGLGWDFKGPGQLRAEVERYQVSEMDVDMYSVGFSFGF